MTALWNEARWGEQVWTDIALTRLGIDGLGVELYGYLSQDVATWGSASAWGTAIWPQRSWHSIAVDVTQAQYSWGADRSLGVLTVAAGGAFALATFDPDGSLNPSNTASPYILDLVPGGYLRLTYEGRPCWIGVLDSVRYQNSDNTGSVAGTDAVGVLSNIKVVVPNSPAQTLRALARELVTLAGLAYIRVEADPPDGDPPVGVPEESDLGEVGLWSAIADAAIDALHYAWVGPDLLIHFRSHGAPSDAGLTLGIAGVPLLELAASSTADGIVNRVLARGPTGTTYTADDIASQRRFGTQTIDRSVRRIPDPVTWADYVLRDRAWASLELLPAAIVPTSRAQLRSLLFMQGMELVRIRTDLTTPAIQADIRSIGLRVTVSPEGWDAAVLGYVSSAEWQDSMRPPPTVVTPNVVGLLLADAGPILDSAGLGHYTLDTTGSTPGLVVSQAPAGGELALVGQAVTLTVVGGTIPAIVGRTEADALASIVASGYVAGTRSELVDRYTAGLVVTQAPTAGTPAVAGTHVAYTVSLGPTRVTRTIVGAKGAWLQSNPQQHGRPGNGAGAALELPVGYRESSQTYSRGLVEHPIDWTNVHTLYSAVLRLRTTAGRQLTIGADPMMRVQAVEEGEPAWQEGTQVTPSPTNAVIWPGPTVTSQDEVVAAIPRAAGSTVEIDVTGIVLRWAPASVAGPSGWNPGASAIGRGLPNLGLLLMAYDDYPNGFVENRNASEYESDDAADPAARPTLILTVGTVP
jgi:hypothetical protein